MKLAIVCRDLRGLGGTTRTVVEHARAFTAKGWDVDVLAYRFDRERLETAGARVRRVPGLPWGSWPKRRLFAAAADFLTRSGYDAVHGHGDNLRQDVLSLHNCVHAAHEAIHGKPLPSSDSVGRLHARQLSERRFRLLICNSKLMADEVNARFGVPRELLSVIYPAHDPAQFNEADKARRRAAARKELGLSDREVVIGLITSGDFEKRGVGLFLEAMAALNRPGLRAVVVGKEAHLGPYLQRVDKLGLGETVRFLPPRRDVETYYHALDVYCHPALYEEFGQSVQEALACGLPVVCGDRVGAAELFPEEMTRFAVAPRSAALVERLAELSSDERLRRRLASQAAASVAANTWAANAEATAAGYASVRRDR